jgi:hypothetical protein
VNNDMGQQMNHSYHKGFGHGMLFASAITTVTIVALHLILRAYA